MIAQRRLRFGIKVNFLTTPPATGEYTSGLSHNKSA
jgi:hypothetical protein